MASRDERDLVPELAAIYHEMRNVACGKGIEILLICTYRSADEQNHLYAQGRSAPGKVVTCLKGGQSRHNTKPSNAFDVVILRHGKPVWDGGDLAYKALGEIGESFNLIWGGSWKSFKDYGHFEMKVKNVRPNTSR